MGGGGVGDVWAFAASQTTVLHMKSQTVSDFRDLVCSLFLKAFFLLLFYSIVAGVVPCGGR